VEGVIPGLILMSEVTRTPALFARPRDLALIWPSFLRTLLFDQHANLLLCPSVLRVVLHLNLKYSDNLFLCFERVQQSIVLVFLARQWAIEGVTGLAVPWLVRLVSCTTTLGFIPMAFFDNFGGGKREKRLFFS